MNIHILNDLHIEFEDFKPPETSADVVVLAGDIGVGVQGLYWAQRLFPDKPVIYVLGNHEFYNNHTGLVDDLKAEARDNIHVLNDDQVIIDGVRFLGSTLWTDFALMGEGSKFFAIQEAQRCMTDFTVIQCDNRCFTPRDAIEMHRVSRDWLTSMLVQPFNGKTVVVTHHAPSSRSIAPRYAGGLLSSAFASNLESLMMGNHRADLWIHGHVHDSFDYEICATRVVCNPRGYAPSALNPDFVSDKVVVL
ncbi:MAG: metallophosphoesterase [Gammaproteobacteria bacterium]|nr:metallophosphoesterase [Gammaproteobacteria bacterium]